MKSTSVYTAATSAACLSGLVVALAPSSSSFTAQRPRSRLPLPLGIVPRAISVPRSSLRSSATDTFKTKEEGDSSFYNVTQHDAVGGSGISPSRADSGANPAVADAAKTKGSTQQQLQQVLSSPELLDPSAILDATIGAAEAFEESADGNASGAIVTQATAVSKSVVAKSKEEDLELTLQTIMRHIDGDTVEVNDVEEGVDNSQPKTAEEEPMKTVASQKQNPKTALTPPSISKILRFTIPAIGIWLCSPVLSMIDTAAVGLLSGTAQQAALNPAVSVTDYGALVVAFMYTATTNLIAAAVQEDKDNNATASSPKTAATLVTSLKLALLVGSVFGVLLGTSGKFLLKLLIGNDALDPAVFSAALKYVRIRSLGLPAMVVIGTAQSACLGMQDVTSPLYVLLAAAAVNFLGDVALVPQSGMFGGAAGAAWATVASQYAALLFFAKWVTTSRKGATGQSTSTGGKKLLNILWKRRSKMEDNNELPYANGDVDVVDVTQGIMELTGTSKAGRSRRKEFRKFLSSSKLSKRVRRGSRMTADTTIAGDVSNRVNGVQDKKQESHSSESQPKTRGFLTGTNKLTLRSYLSLSNLNKSKAKQFLPFFVPVTVTSIGRISGYIAMSHVASSTLSTFEMAGHQIIFSIFCCLTPFVDAISQVAQSFVPALFETKGKSHERAQALTKTTSNFRKVGVGFGAVLVSLVACIPLISRFFTSDPIVMERVKGAIPGLGLFLLVHGLVCGGEGALLGQKDLSFLKNMYAIFFFTVPAYMLRLKYRSLAGLQNVGIDTMWAAFSVYNLIRASIWHLRLAQLQGRTNNEASANKETISR